jgi:Phage integrase, N-terminal SAM-like domain
MEGTKNNDTLSLRTDNADTQLNENRRFPRQLLKSPPNLKPNIREDYRFVIKRYIESDVIGKRPLNKLTLAEMQAWVNRLSTRVAP